MTTDSFKIPAADVHEPIQIWLVRTFDKKMADYHLVELEGKCFFQHKTHKHVMVCANCVEDCKRYHLEYETFQDSTNPHSLKCHGCKASFHLSANPENANPVSINQ